MCIRDRTSAAQIDRLKRHAFSNEVVNDLIFNYYFCERVIKYYFVRHLMSRSNHIVAFEMVIGESRIDICRINGQSYAYEIKTQYDTFDRLGTQMRDYLKTFEKVYVIEMCIRDSSNTGSPACIGSGSASATQSYA